MAWKVAGYYGVDRVLLPRLGTPWTPNSAPAGGGAALRPTQSST
jgi:thiosulfate dehydrogenase [quinone] large subunit